MRWLLLLFLLVSCAMQPAVPRYQIALARGMSPQQVVDAWGMPNNRTEEHSSCGRSEFWTWGNLAQYWVRLEPVRGEWAVTEWGCSRR